MSSMRKMEREIAFQIARLYLKRIPAGRDNINLKLIGLPRVGCGTPAKMWFTIFP